MLAGYRRSWLVFMVSFFFISCRFGGLAGWSISEGEKSEMGYCTALAGGYDGPPAGGRRTPRGDL